jgi:hypothetical protein
LQQEVIEAIARKSHRRPARLDTIEVGEEAFAAGRMDQHRFHPVGTQRGDLRVNAQPL